MKKQKYLAFRKMGCYTLTYDFEPTLFLEQEPTKKMDTPKWHVWSNPSTTLGEAGVIVLSGNGGNPLEDFANSLFGGKVGSIRGNLKGPLNFVIDNEGAETNYDPTTKLGTAGKTVGNRQGITVYMDPDVMGDFDRLYVFLAHELEHAFNISNGSRGAWYNTYGPVLSSGLSEIYAYGVGAQAANGLGLTYDFGQQSQHDQLTIQFLTGLYNK